MASLPDKTCLRSVAPNNWTSPEVNLTGPSVMELVASADDNDYGRDSTNSSGATTQGYDLETMPGDFVSMDTVFVQLRYKVSLY